MKLALIIPTLSRGGAERVATNIANHFASLGWKVTLIACWQGDLAAYLLHPSVVRACLSGPDGLSKRLPRIGFFNLLRWVWTLRALLRKVKPDLALSFMLSANIWLALASIGAPWVAIGSERNYRSRPPCFKKLAQSMFYRFLDAVTALSHETAQWLVESVKVRVAPVIPNAVTWPIPSAEPFLLPDATLPPDRLVLLAVGRMDDGQKGFDLLIDAFATLAEHHTEWDLVILGEGSLRAAFEGQIEAHGLAGRIHMPGAAGNIGDWYGRASLFALSSRWEGMPNVLLEAMAYGVASVSFDCKTGPGDIIRHEMDGLLVPPENVAGLARALSELMGNDDKRALLAVCATEIRARFAPERIMAQWEELFTTLRQEKRQGR